MREAFSSALRYDGDASDEQRQYVRTAKTAGKKGAKDERFFTFFETRVAPAARREPAKSRTRSTAFGTSPVQWASSLSRHRFALARASLVYKDRSTLNPLPDTRRKSVKMGGGDLNMKKVRNLLWPRRAGQR